MCLLIIDGSQLFSSFVEQCYIKRYYSPIGYIILLKHHFRWQNNSSRALFVSASRSWLSDRCVTACTCFRFSNLFVCAPQHMTLFNMQPLWTASLLVSDACLREIHKSSFLFEHENGVCVVYHLFFFDVSRAHSFVHGQLSLICPRVTSPF